jgi:hypothetical protein
MPNSKKTYFFVRTTIVKAYARTDGLRAILCAKKLRKMMYSVGSKTCLKESSYSHTEYVK